MKIWGVSEADIRAAAAEVGVTLWGDSYPAGGGISPVGRALSVRLCVDRAQPRNEAGLLPFQRLGQTPNARDQRSRRRLPYVCWHGHKRFMLAVFDRNPEARIKTALADYRGREDFLSTHKGTFGQGNDYHLAYGQRCAGRHPTERRGHAPS